MNFLDILGREPKDTKQLFRHWGDPDMDTSDISRITSRECPSGDTSYVQIRRDFATFLLFAMFQHVVSLVRFELSGF